MFSKRKPLPALTAGDVMSKPVEVIRLGTPLPSAAHLLRQAGVSGAPVVDEAGRCVGILSASDFLRWAARQGPGGGAAPSLHTCRYQKDERRASGEPGAVCLLAQGGCALQAPDRTAGGEEKPFCLLPDCILFDWQQVVEGPAPGDAVEQYMTRDVVTVAPEVPLTRVARLMIDADIHRVVVDDELGRPLGIVSGTDVLAAVAAEIDWF
jgi:CBS domain-containing protein